MVFNLAELMNRASPNFESSIHKGPRIEEIKEIQEEELAKPTPYFLYVLEDNNSKKAIDLLGPRKQNIITVVDVKRLKDKKPTWLEGVPTLLEVKSKLIFTGSSCIQQLQKIMQNITPQPDVPPKWTPILTDVTEEVSQVDLLKEMISIMNLDTSIPQEFMNDVNVFTDEENSGGEGNASDAEEGDASETEESDTGDPSKEETNDQKEAQIVEIVESVIEQKEIEEEKVIIEQESPVKEFKKKFRPFHYKAVV